MSKRIAVALVATLALGWPAIDAQDASQHHSNVSLSEYIKWLEDPRREEWQKPQEVIEKLELRPGQSVADLGAGSGYFTVRLARAVGPSGKVYAVDVEPGMLEYLGRRAKRERLENIESVLAPADNPKLPPSSVDMIFICNTLHHIANRDKYYPLLTRALKPGGRLVNIDFHKREMPIGPPVEEKIAKEDVIKEVEPAAFRLVKDFEFLEYQYFLVFER